MNRKIVSFFLLILTSGISYSQTLKGRIINVSGDPVPYSTVYIRELKQGTTANTRGDYEIKVPPGSYLVTYQSLGYSPVFYNITITENTIIRNVTLPVQYYEIPEVRISATGEDPACNIMRKAIGMAPYYLNYINSYKAGVYIKGDLVFTRIPRLAQRAIRIESDGDPSTENFRIKENEVYMMESYNEIEYRAPDKYNQRVISVNSTFPEQGDNISPMDIVQASFYQPVIADIAISPLSPEAFSYYKFKYMGASLQGDNTVSKIEVIPRMKSQQLFQGTIYIIEDLWCIHSLDLTNDNIAGKIRIEQLYIPVEENIWMPVSLKFEMQISILGFRADAGYGTSIKYTEVIPDRSLIKPVSTYTAGRALPPASGTAAEGDRAVSGNMEKIGKIMEKEELTNRDMMKMARLMKKESWKTVPDSIKEKLEIKDNRTVKIEKDAGKKDSTYWAEIRPIPLSDAEMRSISIRDSIKNELKVNKSTGDTLRNQPEKEKSKLVNVLNRISSGHSWQNKEGTGFHFGGIVDPENLRFNPVDGFVWGLDFRLNKNLENKRSLYIAPETFYAFSREKLMWRINGGYNFKRSGSLWFRTGVMSRDISDGGSINSFLNSVTSLFFKENYLRLYESRYLFTGIRGEVMNGLRLDLSAGYEKRHLPENSTNFSFFRKSEQYSANIPYNPWLDEVTDPALLLSDQTHYEITANISWLPRQRYRMNDGVRIPAGSDWPLFSLTWKHGINRDTEPVEGTRHFDMLRFEASKLHEPGAFSEFRWRVRTGGILNNNHIPFYDFFHFNIQSVPVLLNDYQDAFYLPDFYSLSTPEFFGELHLKYTTPYLLLKYLPGLSNTLIRENLIISWLGTHHHSHYTEIGYSMTELLLLGEAGIFAGFDNLKFTNIGFRIIFKIN